MKNQDTSIIPLCDNCDDILYNKEEIKDSLCEECKKIELYYDEIDNQHKNLLYYGK